MNVVKELNIQMVTNRIAESITRDLQMIEPTHQIVEFITRDYQIVEPTRRMFDSMARNMQMASATCQINNMFAETIEASTANPVLNEALTGNAQAIGRQMSEAIAESVPITDTARQVGDTFASFLKSTSALRELSHGLAQSIDSATATTFAEYLPQDRLNHAYQTILQAFSYIPGANDATSHEVADAVEAATDNVSPHSPSHLVARRFLVAVGVFVVLHLMVIAFKTFEHVVADEANLATLIASILAIYKFIEGTHDSDDPQP